MPSNSKNKYVLITVPSFKLKGGVVDFFKYIDKFLSINHKFFQFFPLGKKENFFSNLSYHISVQRNFYKKIRTDDLSLGLVHINPSFDYRAIVRDALFLITAKKYNKKVLVFFHGWNEKFENIVDRYFKYIFCFFYQKADAFIVLANQFKQKLRKWGFKQPIFLMNTPVDDILLKNYSQDQRIKNIGKNRPFRFLFLSRIEKEKGIIETIETIKCLVNRGIDVELVVAGDGSYLDKAKYHSQKLALGNRIKFLGFVKDKAKIQAFTNADIFLFPSYREGMPIALLEAMAFGLPILTRPVGGIKDFFKHGENGFLIENKSPEIFAKFAEKIIKDKKLWTNISQTNHKYAKQHFMASKVAVKLTQIYTTLLERNSYEYCKHS